MKQTDREFIQSLIRTHRKGHYCCNDEYVMDRINNGYYFRFKVRDGVTDDMVVKLCRIPDDMEIEVNDCATQEFVSAMVTLLVEKDL